MSSPRCLLSMALLALALLVSDAAADQVRLTNGNVLEGRARRDGDRVIVVTKVGEVRLPASEVREIVPGKTRLDEYQERAAKLSKGVDGKDAVAHFELGEWCRGKDLKSQARRHWKRALELDADHRGARQRLGFIRYDGRWVTEAEYYEARGFVRHEGKWVHADELRRSEALRAARKAQREHVRKIRSCIAKMSSMKRKKRQSGKVELQEYAEERADLRLAAFATQVADHYNEQWRRVKVSLSSAKVLTEVRATHAQLRRPIPEIQTSLGAFSTPVRIQLPELAVAQVRTTVLIPADIELDDD